MLPAGNEAYLRHPHRVGLRILSSVTTHARLPLTGERTVPGIDHENYWFRRHEAAYRWVGTNWATDLLGQQAVDAGCGEGYGAALLAHATDRPVIGLELDALAAKHAHATYHPAIEVLSANLDAFPLVNECIGVLVSMQVVEHLWDLPKFLAECHRVLVPGGLCVISTPNRLTFSPGLERGQPPMNPFHVEEFDAAQLVEIVAQAGFEPVDVWGLHHSGALADWECENTDIVEAQVARILGDRNSQPVAATVGFDLLAAVTGVTCDDFAITRENIEQSRDLIVVATRSRQF